MGVFGPRSSLLQEMGIRALSRVGGIQVLGFKAGVQK